MGLGWLHALANHRGLRRLWLRVRVGAVMLGVCLSLPFLSWDWFWVGFSVALAGELIQLWCFANLDKNSSICARGPYALVRNPMYLGRYFLVAGVLLLYRSPYLVVVMTLAYGVYMVNRVQREETLLTGIFQDGYRDYCRKVSRFWPALRPAPGDPVATWQWRLFRKNHGMPNLLGLLALFLLAGWAARLQPVWTYPW